MIADSGDLFSNIPRGCFLQLGPSRVITPNATWKKPKTMDKIGRYQTIKCKTVQTGCIIGGGIVGGQLLF